MKTLSALGRFIYAIPFGIFGILHFMYAPAWASMVLKGWPIAEGLTYIVGLAFILAAVSIILNIKARLACLLLALLLLIFDVTLHIPGMLAGGQMAQMQLGNFLKDTALMGAALTYAGILNK